MALITNATLELVKSEIEKRNQKLRQFAETYAATTWDTIQLDVRTLSQTALATKYPLGTELTCKYNYNGTEYDFPWVVLDNNRKCKWADNSEHQGLWLGAKYATIETIQYDAPEIVEATEETAQAGVYYFKMSGSDYVALNLSTGDTIPTDQGTIYKHSINSGSVIRYGYNNYKKSAIRQWLNSNKARNLWWEAQHDYDVAPGQATTEDGFLYRLDPDMVAVITPVQVKTSCNTVSDGGVTETVCDKFFLQSLEEVYGSPQIADVEGPFFPQWKVATGLSSPKNGSSTDTNAARMIKALNAQSGSAVYAWLRSAHRSYVYNGWNFSSGYLSNYSVNNALRALPACVIS